MKKIGVILGVIVFLICEFLIIFINFIPRSYNQENEVLALKRVIYRRLITPDSLIKKYNKVLSKNNFNEIDLEYLTNIDETYYIGLYQDVVLFITPLAYNDFNNDIVYQTGIIVNSETDNFELAKLYYKYLIEANNEFIFNASSLVDLVLNGEMVEENNGLILAAIVSNGEINLFIERKYNS